MIIFDINSLISLLDLLVNVVCLFYQSWNIGYMDLYVKLVLRGWLNKECIVMAFRRFAVNCEDGFRKPASVFRIFFYFEVFSHFLRLLFLLLVERGHRDASFVNDAVFKRLKVFETYFIEQFNNRI